MELSTLEAAKAHAIAEFPKESCGLIVRAEDGEVYVPCRNTAETPNAHFTLPPEDYMAAEDLGEVTGLVHSHPGSAVEPSEGDRASCEASGLEWFILRTDRDEDTGDVGVTDTYSWKPTGWRAPLIGRSFHYGVLDCWALARDWYREELGVELADVDHGPDGWWNDLETDFSPYESQANYDKAGLVRVDGGPLQRGDLIIMQIRSRAGKPNHVGILIDDQRCIMLHHLYNALSDRVLYGGYWRDTTRFVLRRKT